MKRIALLTILLCLVLGLYAQINKYGTPIIKNYSTQITHGSEYNWWITKDKFGAVYFANDEKGVIRFDGNNWTNIPVRNNSRIRALDTDEDGKIYAGGANEFGYIEPGIGGPEYISLSQRFDSQKNKTESSSENKKGATEDAIDDVAVGEITSLVAKDSLVYFLSRESLFIYNTDSDSLQYINLGKQGYRQFIRIYSIEDRIILAENVRGLMEFKYGKPEPLPGGDFFKRKICLTVLPVSKGKVLVGTYNTGMFLYDFINGVVDKGWIDKSLNEKISGIYCGAKISSGEFVIGTVGGSGIYVIDNNGKLIGFWNNEKTELQDNNICALYVDPDRSSELWISTMGYISKAYTNIPVTKFGSLSAVNPWGKSPNSGANGIDGAVNAICEFNGVIYVATDLGVSKSAVDKDGCSYFEGVKEIEDQTLSLQKAVIGNESFILAGSINGLYQITKSGEVINIKNVIKYKKADEGIPYQSRCITQSRMNPDLFYIGLMQGLVVIEYLNGKWKQNRNIIKLPGSVSFQQECDNGDLFVMTDSPGELYKLKLNDTILTKNGNKTGLPADVILNSLTYIRDNIVVSTERGLYRYNEDSDSWIGCDDLTDGYSSGKNVNFLSEDPQNDIWLEVNENSYRTMLFSLKEAKPNRYTGPLNLLPNANLYNICSINDRIWLAKSNNIFVIDKKKLLDSIPEIPILLSKIQIGVDSVIMKGSFFKELKNGKRIPVSSFPESSIPEIKYALNSISFFWTTPDFIEEDLTVYSYRLEGFSNNWSKWESILYKDFTNLPPGKYTFMVKAVNSLGISDKKPATFNFVITPPFYQTWWFILLSIFIAAVIIAAFIRTQNLVRDKKILEKRVVERTSEISQKNLELEDKNKNITASIIYAERIQRAILPRKEFLESLLKEYFIIFKPRDIVSGDFYWGTKIENIIIIAAVDCTGHGVPGAFMSILGASFLNEIVNKEYVTHPGVILRRLRKEVIHSLQQRGEYGEQKDGMDISLCAIDYENMKLQYAGANNPLYLIRSAGSKRLDVEKQVAEEGFILYEIKGNKMPISIYDAMDNFTSHEIDILKGDAIYLFSDGFADQFGGPSGKKLQYKNFKKIILNHCSKSMNDQMHLIGKDLEDWRGDNNQIDDDLLIGFRII